MQRQKTIVTPVLKQWASKKNNPLLKSLRRRIFFAIMNEIFRRGDFNGQQSLIQRSIWSVCPQREGRRQG